MGGRKRRAAITASSTAIFFGRGRLSLPSMSDASSLADASIPAALARVRAEIAEACARAGRPPDSVQLVAVSKTHPAESVVQALAAGQAVFGENRHEKVDQRVQEIYPEGMHTVIAEALRRLLAADGVE